MALARAKHGGYLFRRDGSDNWWIKLRSGGKRIERSLGTADRAEAEIIAMREYIPDHKARLLAARPRLVVSWWHEHEPGRKHVIEGKEIIATERELLYLNDEGAIVERKQNGGPAHQLLNLPIGAVIVGDKTTRPLAELHRQYKGATFVNLDRLRRGTVPTKNGDDAILETYLKHANVTGYYEREARAVWALYKTLTDSKPLKDSDRDDGRKLVAHFESKGLKSETIAKKIGWLRAAVNLAISERKECRSWLNPFAGIVPKVRDKTRRLPLSDADMKEIKRNIARLSESDQLLARLLASTGMRLSEAFEIDGEEKEKGCRYVIVGKKTEQSLRRVPLPAAVLPFLPKAIKGPLFVSDHVDPSDAASKRLNRFLDDCGIADPRKVVHSLRHRAQDRLRAASCPEDVRWAILGHEEETVAAGYGEGFPVPLLRKWIDKIGF